MALAASVATRSAVDQVFAKLKVDIVSGKVPSGSKINELELARLYAVSRSTVREAIGRLELAHLVTRRANVGARVVELSKTALLELFLVRESLEGMACRLAAQRMSDRAIDELSQLVESDLQQGEMSGQVLLQLDDNKQMDFHHRIIQGSGNAQLTQLLFNELYPQVSMYRYQFSLGSARVPAGFNEHRGILDAIRNRDPELAEILMRRHIQASRLSIENQLQ